MTDERTAFRLQFLKTLGAPLMAAVNDAMPAADDKAAAEQIAGLLARTVQASITLSESLKIGAPDDAVRAALAGLAARLLAAQYAAGGKMPGDADIKRMAASMDAVLAFADNFMAGAEGRARLELTDAGALPDENQIAIQFAVAMAPVITEVAAFSFGRPEKKLLQEIADRLSGDAEELRRELAGDNMAAPAARRADLQCLCILCDIYAACHRAETRHLGAMPAEARDKLANGGPIPMEPVWEAYCVRRAMLGVLAGVPARGAAGGGAVALRPAPVAAAPVPVTAAAPVAAPIVAAPAAEKPAGDGGPMSFFAKKKAAGDDTGTIV
jgi:hypothetical protein